MTRARLFSRQSDAAASDASLPLSGIVALLVVYAVWGSTFLAMRIAVRPGSGFPPFLLGGSRVALAGALLVLAGALLARGRGRLARRDVVTLAASGSLIWVTGHGLILWAEQWAASGYAALVFASVPIWVAVMEAALERRLPSRGFAASLLVGFGGIALLSLRGVENEPGAGPWPVVALLVGAVSWAAGTVVQRRRPVAAGAVTSSGVQQLAASAGFLVVALALREPAPAPTAEAWGAWAYLLVFGSLVAFTAFVHAVRVLPSGVANTYAYVNPVVAVALGWWILDEPVTPLTLAGAALVLAGVVGVFRERRRTAAPRP